jgi:hypothetical protein
MAGISGWYAIRPASIGDTATITRLARQLPASLRTVTPLRSWLI